MANRSQGPRAIAALLVVALAPAAWPGKAHAQGICENLWFERNEIYARKGFCFKTARARATFGAGCFPPYGQLSGFERRRVEDIQAEENARGCPR